MKNVLTNMEVEISKMGVDYDLVAQIEEQVFAKNSDAPYGVITRNLDEWTTAILNEIHVAGVTRMANKIEFCKHGEIKIELQKLSRGPLAKAAKVEAGPVTKEGLSLGDNYAYTRELLVVNVAENKKAGKLIKRNGLAIKYKLAGFGAKKKQTRVIEQVYTISTSKNDVLTLTPCIKDKGVKTEPIFGDSAKMVLDTCVHYRIQSASQAQERNVEMILSNWDADYALAVKFALSGRFLTELFYKHNGNINFNAAAKEWFKRDALIGSTMIPFGEISKEYGTGMIVTFNEFRGNVTDVVEVEKANKIGYMQDDSSEKFKKANNGTKDGIAFGRKSYISMASYKEYGIGIMPNMLNIDPQMRITGAGVKSLFELKEDKVFDAIEAEVKADGIEISVEEAKRRIEEARNNGGKAKFNSNEYVILGDRNNICFIADDNASKYLAFEGKYRVMMLDVPRVNKKKINLSWQAFNKIVSFASEETLEYLSDKFADDMAGKVKETLVDNDPTLLGNTSTVALSLNKEAKRVYDNILALIKDNTQEMTSKIEGCKVSVDGIFARAAFESSDMIVKSMNLLKADSYYAEVFCPSLEDGEEVMGLKFPCPTKDEFQIYKNVGIKTMASRIEVKRVAGEITDKEAELLLANFKGYGAATLVIVQEDSLKHKQAGMDTDYDGLQLIRDKKIVADAVADYKAKGYCGETIAIAKMK